MTHAHAEQFAETQSLVVRAQFRIASQVDGVHRRELIQESPDEFAADAVALVLGQYLQPGNEGGREPSLIALMKPMIRPSRRASTTR